MNNQLIQYAELVAEWGTKLNLVSNPNKDSVMAEHITDCVQAYECLAKNLSPDTSTSLPIVDIGSGAGFPGIVWAILNPSTKTYLIEPREKRVTFLRHVALKLPLKNVEVICSRFEDLPREQLPERCLFTSRALGYDADLTDALLKDVAANGSVWAVMSGPESLEKLRNGVKRTVAESEVLEKVETESFVYELGKNLGSRALFVCSCG